MYAHCACIEESNFDEKNAIYQGLFELRCEDGVVELGSYKDGKKEGQWILKNKKGKLISSINYSNGRLDGNFLLYYFNGKIKLSASFDEGLKVGFWQFYNEKEKVINPLSLAYNEVLAKDC